MNRVPGRASSLHLDRNRLGPSHLLLRYFVLIVNPVAKLKITCRRKRSLTEPEWLQAWPLRVWAPADKVSPNSFQDFMVRCKAFPTKLWSGVHYN